MATRLLFALPGFHLYERGAEIALLSVANALARDGNEVTVMGSGQIREDAPYRFVHVPSIPRERFEKFPQFPVCRSETAWEDASFSLPLLRAFNPSEFDVVVTCSFPFTHWSLRRPSRHSPLQIFVTQNGDWPAWSNDAEYRTFSCNGLVCTNPDYFERNREKWECALIPNGVDLDQFTPGPAVREKFGLPVDKKVVLMVSAFIESKRVLEGIRAVAELEDVFLIVAGDGPLRDVGQRLGDALLPSRYMRITVPANEMPDLYRAADAFLHLSLQESFGNVFLEAWASGLPVIGHDSERLRWIFGDSSQYLGDTQDRDLLVSLLKRALAAGPSLDRAKEIERFSWPSIAKQYETFIGGLLKARGGADKCK